MEKFIKLFTYDGQNMTLNGDELVAGSARIPLRNGIPRFPSDLSYSSGNFSILREKHGTLQFDSQNGTIQWLDTILARTNWPASFFKDKLVLECGCGAGPDTEILLSLGAKVVSVDLAGQDAARKNLGENPNLCLVQASITDLPLKERSFDIVFCHRVLQHTPSPKETLDHILRFVKSDGAVFVHSYAASFRQLFRWKYVLRPLTTRMDSEKLYNLIKWYSGPTYKFTSLTGRSRLGRFLNHMFIPFLNYRHKPALANKDDKFMIEYGIHDTFDALSPKYDHPLTISTMEKIASRRPGKPFEVVSFAGITLLRTEL